jgi:hypothetical protein
LYQIVGGVQRRKAVRLKLPSLRGELAMDRDRHWRDEPEYRPIAIMDMSPYGLRFQTNQYIVPGEPLTIRAKLSGPIRVELTGKPVWSRKIDNLYEYGMELEITESQSLLLSRLLLDVLRELSPGQKEIHRLYKRSALAAQFHSMGEKFR